MLKVLMRIPILKGKILIYWIFDLFGFWEDTTTSDPNKGYLLGPSSPNLMKRDVPFCIHCK